MYTLLLLDMPIGMRGPAWAAGDVCISAMFILIHQGLLYIRGM